jgi:hypothetical protein
MRTIEFLLDPRGVQPFEQLAAYVSSWTNVPNISSRPIFRQSPHRTSLTNIPTPYPISSPAVTLPKFV